MNKRDVPNGDLRALKSKRRSFPGFISNSQSFQRTISRLRATANQIAHQQVEITTACFPHNFFLNQLRVFLQHVNCK